MALQPQWGSEQAHVGRRARGPAQVTDSSSQAQAAPPEMVGTAVLYCSPLCWPQCNINPPLSDLASHLQPATAPCHAEATAGLEVTSSPPPKPPPAAALCLCLATQPLQFGPCLCLTPPKRLRPAPCLPHTVTPHPTRPGTSLSHALPCLHLTLRRAARRPHSVPAGQARHDIPC